MAFNFNKKKKDDIFEPGYSRKSGLYDPNDAPKHKLQKIKGLLYNVCAVRTKVCLCIGSPTQTIEFSFVVSYTPKVELCLMLSPHRCP